MGPNLQNGQNWKTQQVTQLVTKLQLYSAVPIDVGHSENRLQQCLGPACVQRLEDVKERSYLGRE